MERVSKNQSAKEVRVLQDSDIYTPDMQATTNDYTDVDGSLVDARGATSVAFVITNTDDANDLDWKVLASIDGVTFVEVQAEETLGEEVTDSYTTIPALYAWYKIQVKSTAGGSHAEATIHAIAK